MTILLNTPITTPNAAALSSVLQLRAFPGASDLPSGILFQSNLTFGSGGTAISAWVQTSLDGGTTWCDAAFFSYPSVIAASVRSFLGVATGAVAAAFIATDGGVGDTPLTANTAAAGIFGNLWRVSTNSSKN